MEYNQKGNALTSDPQEGVHIMPIHSIEYMKNAGYPATTITSIAGCNNRTKVRVTRNGLEIKVFPSKKKN